jgi:hypothetical protein
MNATPTEEKGLNLIAADPLVVGPPAPEGHILRQIKGLRGLVIEVLELLVEFEHGQGEFAVGHPGDCFPGHARWELQDFGQLAIDLELQVTLNRYIFDRQMGLPL